MIAIHMDKGNGREQEGRDLNKEVLIEVMHFGRKLGDRFSYDIAVRRTGIRRMIDIIFENLDLSALYLCSERQWWPPVERYLTWS
jgi:hypothetical protein